MIERKRDYEIKHGNGDTLYKRVLESIESPATGPKAQYIQHEVLRQISEDVGLTYCSTFPFENLSMRHDGTRWIVTVTALELSKDNL